MKRLLATFLCLFVGFAGTMLSAKGAESDLPFKRIPGLTQAEVDAIETLQKEGRSLIYGALLSTETFPDEKGEVSGYTPQLCALLSRLFGIPFTPSLYEWDAIIDGLKGRHISFSGEFTITPERKHDFIMSDAVAVRSVALIYSADARTLGEVAAERTPTLGFLTDAVHEQQLAELYKGDFEPYYAKNIADIAQALKTGAIDAFVCDNVAEPAFEGLLDIRHELFVPLLPTSVALTTQDESLAAIVSVFDKYIANGGRAELSALYAQSMADYARDVLRKKLNSQEKAFIDEHVAANKKVPVILESGNYPVSFYNAKSKQYEGIVPDLLERVSLLTGLEFESVNAPEEDWATVLAKLQSGQAAIISELLHTPSRNGQFLWPEEPSCVTHYALLSKSAAPNLEFNQMLGKRIGVEIDTAYQDVAKQWFPDVALFTYASIDEAFEALEYGRIDLIMASENLLLSQTNYSEKTGYKVNFIIDQTAESKIGFNINETTLLSIFNKAFPYIESNTITRNWSTRVFDYAAQLSQARVNLLLISTLLLGAFIVLLTAFLLKNNRHRRDLSSLVKARTSQLEEKTTALSTIYNAIPDILFSRDTEGRYTSCNPSFEEYAGLKESEIIGKLPSDIFPQATPETIVLETTQDESVFRDGVSTVSEQLFIYPNGEKRLFETITTALKQNDTIVGMMGISRDITAHKEAQEAALAASKAKSAFLARMSHEIRTPLNAITGMATITKASLGNPEKTVSSVNQILISSDHLLRLINDVLDMSKIESGNLEVLCQPFNLRTALEETLAIGSARCKEKQLAFESNISSIPNMPLLGDKLRLNQVLINLISNATKFTNGNGHVAFHVSILEETEKNVRLQFSVKDTGIGMSEEQLSRLFKPFEQADNSIAARFGGTGLGLSISQNLIEKMGSHISVQSVLGEGSEFFFNLLFEKSEAALPDIDLQNRPLDLTGSRILLAEDIEINSEIVKELLTSTNVTIDTAVNGREATEMFGNSAPGYYQLIFMDIQMPEMNGYEATEHIRSLPRSDAKDIPIIAMTANAYKEDVDQSLASGMNGHIGKPIDINELMRTLAYYSRNSEA